jgi:uncharacterized NAD(P)/FAD-binding protein YdhS
MNPFKLAIIGAGPSALYVAARIFKVLPKSTAFISSTGYGLLTA